MSDTINIGRRTADEHAALNSTGPEADETHKMPSREIDDSLADVARQAALQCAAPAALVTLVVDRQQVFRARFGISVRTAPADIGFCPLVTAMSVPVVLHDTSVDPRYASEPCAIGEFVVRSYAGVPLTLSNGKTIGALSVMDSTPHEFRSNEIHALERLARHAVAHLELQTSERELVRVREENAGLRAVVRAQRNSRIEANIRLDRYALAFDNLYDALIITDVNGCILDVNPAFTRLFGYARHESLGRSVFELQTPSDAAYVLPKAFSEMLARGRWTGEIRLACKDGGEAICESSLAPLYDEQANVAAVVAACRDITESKRADDALRASETMYRTLGEAVPNFIWSCAADGTALFLNQRWMDYTGLTLETAGSVPTDVMHHPDDIAGLQAIWAEAAMQGRAYEAEFRFRRRDGVYRWFLARAVPILNSRNEVTQWIGTTTDVHDRKVLEIELRERSEQLALAIREVHHRVKNSLNAVSGLLEMQIAPGQEIVSVDAIHDGLKQIKAIGLVHDLLAHDEPMGAVDASRVLTALVDLFRAGLRSQGREPQVELEAVSIEMSTKAATALALIVNELLTNAYKHSRSRSTDLSGGDVGLMRVTMVRSSDHVLLTVEDSGPGFSSDFEPTRDSNIGLDLVQSLAATDLHGTIRFSNVSARGDSGASGGACVAIDFPVSAVS